MCFVLLKFRNLTVGTVDAFAGVVLRCEIAGGRGEGEIGTSTRLVENIGRNRGERRSGIQRLSCRLASIVWTCLVLLVCRASLHIENVYRG